MLIPTGLSKHLHFICSDPVFYPRTGKDSVLVVNLSTLKNEFECDKTCILDVRDHPFIQHPSYIYYRRAEILIASGISRNVAEGNFFVRQPCDEDVFSRILKGFNVSEEVTPKIKRFHEKYCR